MYWKLVPQAASSKDFVTFWSSQYSYKSGIEDYNINIAITPIVQLNIQKLFEWKNGSVLSTKKQATLNKIIEKLPTINSLKAEWDLAMFESEFNFLPSIWKIFLLHIIRPEEYPIFDMHVYRAYTFITNGKSDELVNYNNPKKYILYKERYLPFYSSITELSGCSLTDIDKALWAYGKFISLYRNMLHMNT